MRWLPTLFAAEAIPSAMITFVALLMFLQLGAGWGTATALCGLLSLPWVLKSFVRERVRRLGRFSVQLKVVEVLLCGALVALAFSFGGAGAEVWPVFCGLLAVCLLCAWHELAARMYYERMLRPRVQRYYNSWKMFASQATVVLTYGVMLVFVGFLQVFYHTRPDALALSWGMAVYVLAGVYLLLVACNLLMLRPPHVGDRPQTDAFGSALLAEVHVIERIRRKPRWLWAVGCLLLLLLPQALLFHSRVLFFVAPRAVGGLAAPLQWVGLAQGTFGVIAFSAGLGVGHWWAVRGVGCAVRGGEYAVRGRGRLFASMALALTISPWVYWILSLWQPSELAVLCASAAVAQFCFGYGLNGTMLFVRYLSGERYRSTINYLYIPVVALVMLAPVVASGYLADALGFPLFFLVVCLLSPLVWLAARVGWGMIYDGGG